MNIRYVLRSGLEYVKEFYPKTLEVKIVLTDDIEKALKVDFVDAQVLSRWLSLDFEPKNRLVMYNNQTNKYVRLDSISDAGSLSPGWVEDSRLATTFNSIQSVELVTKQLLIDKFFEWAQPPARPYTPKDITFINLDDREIQN